MVVKDKAKVVGRGCIIVTEPDCEINMSDKVIVGKKEFEIAGIERLSVMKTIGLVLRPNDIAQETINIGDKIEIIK